MIDEKLILKIRELACHPDWRKRETAASEIKIINDSSFEEYFPVWKRWVKDSDPNIRRAAEVGLLRIKKEYAKDALELLEPLLYDKNIYVRKNCGPFALSFVCYKNPDLGFQKLEEWMKIGDANARWNIAMCLGVYFGLSQPEKSLALLKTLAADRNRFVWRAAASSLVKLLRRFPEYKKKIYGWKDSENAVEVVKKYVGVPQA